MSIPRVIRATSPDDALYKGLAYLTCLGVRNESRNGQVLQSSVPVITVYENPRARVSLSVLRDANPFFHLMESLWMLAGHNDVAFIKRYAASMAQFSDDDTTLWGAYGHRWRKFFGFDQLLEVIEKLRADPSTRRAVIGMWSPVGDLTETAKGEGVGKDIPCNTQVYFDATLGQLNMTVTNRSNDVVWGAYGANVVHMSYLHEFVALCTGLRLGVYYQFSNNYHVYTTRPDVVRLLEGLETLEDQAECTVENAPLAPVAPQPLHAVRALSEIETFVGLGAAFTATPGDLELPFLLHTALPMAQAHAAYKAGYMQTALNYAGATSDPAWRLAAVGWLLRRELSKKLPKDTR